MAEDFARSFFVVIGDVGKDDAEGRSLRLCGLFVGQLFFEGNLLEFNNALSSGKGADEYGDKLCEGAHGRLNLTNELHKGYERTIGDESFLQMHHSPGESEHIARSKTEVHQARREGGILRAPNDMAAQGGLSAGEPLRHGGDAAKGLDDKGVLQAFLKDGLEMALGVAHIVGDAAHSLHVEFAGQQEDGEYKDDDAGQRAVHPEEEEEGSGKLKQRGDERGQALGDEAHHIGDVALKAIDKVARVHLAQGPPLGLEQAVEEALLHIVLCANAEDGAHPATANIDGHLDDNQANDEGDGLRKGEAVVGSCGYINGQLRGPHETQIGHNHQPAQQNIEQALQAITLPRLPEPAYQRGIGTEAVKAFLWMGLSVFQHGCFLWFQRRLARPSVYAACGCFLNF